MIELALKNAEQGRADRDALEVASVASRSMLELIGDILDIARIESGHLSLALEPANLKEQLASIVRVFDGLARAKGLVLQVELDSTIDRTVLIDPLRFKQVVSNLLSNAIKFTASGQVQLGAQGGVAGDQLTLRLWVQDSGIGISAEDQQRLFNPFIQGSNTEQSARSGSGLGLVISRNLCEMLGGQLHLSSVLGQGTRVDVRMVLAVTAALPAQVLSAVLETPPPQALDILVVDDYRANRLLLGRQLSFLGHRITTADDGLQGVQYWQAGHFDVVITDCNMPLKNGYQLAHDIRAQERERGLVPCLLLGFTANAQPEEVERCRQAGMDGCLFKPTSLDDLRLALASCVARAAQADSLPMLDLSTLTGLTGDDQGALKELLIPLIESLKADLEWLSLPQQAFDFAKLHDLAHRAKGGARMVKAQALIDRCEALEAACETQDRQALGPAIEGVSAAISDLHQALSVYCNQL